MEEVGRKVGGNEKRRREEGGEEGGTGVVEV